MDPGRTEMLEALRLSQAREQELTERLERLHLEHLALQEEATQLRITLSSVMAQLMFYLRPQR